MERGSERFLIITYIMQHIVCLCVCERDISSDVDMCLPPPLQAALHVEPSWFFERHVV